MSGGCCDVHTTRSGRSGQQEDVRPTRRYAFGPAHGRTSRLVAVPAVPDLAYPGVGGPAITGAFSTTAQAYPGAHPREGGHDRTSRPARRVGLQCPATQAMPASQSSAGGRRRTCRCTASPCASGSPREQSIVGAVANWSRGRVPRRTTVADPSEANPSDARDRAQRMVACSATGGRAAGHGVLRLCDAAARGTVPAWLGTPHRRRAAGAFDGSSPPAPWDCSRFCW